jgi:integrase
MAIHRLRPSDIDRLKRTKGKHSDGGGLVLQVTAPGQASWVFRYKDRQERRERWPCISPASAYTLDQAREKARLCRVELQEGRNPSDFLASGRAAATGKTFGEAMAEYLDAKSPTWADSNRARELRRYNSLFSQIPDFTALPIKSIDQDARNKALAAWEAGSKKHRDVGFYIEAILRHALTGKLRLRSSTDDIQHHEAMPWRDVPNFYKSLPDVGDDDARALRFTILTGARTDEVIGRKENGAWVKPPATWAEIEETDGKPVWVIPKNRMKAKRDHRVPLSPEALAVLGRRRADNAPLFKVSSANAMLNTLKALDGNGYTVHGFRSSFEDWGAEATNFSRDLVKLCTAHDKRTKTDKAYQRSDLLEKRREIMQRWSDYVAPGGY